MCFVVGMTAVRASGNLTKRVWFRVVLAVMITLHLALVMLVSWTDRVYPGYALLPYGILDYGIWYGSFKLTEKLMTRNTEAGSA